MPPSKKIGREFVTKTGRELTDEDIRLLAAEAERGYDITPLLVAQRDAYRRGLEQIEDLASGTSEDSRYARMAREALDTRAEVSCPPNPTDKEVFAAMLDRAGVVYTAESNPPVAHTVIEIEAKKGPRNEGYDGFVADFAFDSSGKLHRVGLWE